MKRFKVSSNNSNKLTSHDFEALATKLAASWPPRRPPKPLPKIEDLMEGLQRANKLHRPDKKSVSDVADTAGYVYLGKMLLETVGSATGLGSLLGTPLQFVGATLAIMKNLKPTFQKKIASTNPIFAKFDEKIYEIKIYASANDITKPTRITNPYATKMMSLRQISESFEEASAELDGGWVGKGQDPPVYIFANDSDVREIERMIKKMDAKAMSTIATILVIAAVPGYIGVGEAWRASSDKKARESPTGQAVKREGEQVAPLTTDPSKISPSLQERLNKKPTKPTDTFRTQKYPNRKK
jgi:hypothetical protein